ncbi:ABC transporter substrate-binding protein [Acuticoccus sp. M5D2P5]|uniref:ABC transporter substrate-binding protein n=1 Tax=Acuticoccus kalidii TaxID=2910977 RepID=UPI001F29F852|nr:ABC transporter substrate-binding protein [Acuticoccus kalidii]MCF3935191.1 ABC transporter substrate-binding protein [Acuticoccus kalidii]
MTKKTSLMSAISRRSLLRAGVAGGAAGAAFFGPFKHNRVLAQSEKPIKIGLTMDASGMYANSGQSERRGAIMAIEEFNDNGGVLGRPIEHVWYDTETTPQTGTRVAERMITRDNVHFMMGAIQSGVANAISQVAQKYGCIYLNTNSSSPTEAGENCHRVKFVFDGNGENFTRATSKNAIETFGPRWLIIYSDYVWGQDTKDATREVATSYGAEIMDEVPVPVGTRDFSGFLLRIQQAKPDVVATAIGGDDYKVLRQQVRDMGLEDQIAWVGNQQDWPDIYGLGTDAAFGVFGTTFYHYLDLPGVPEFVAKYKARYPETRVDVPGNVFHQGYMAAREMLRVIEEVGSTDNIKLIKAMEGRRFAAEDRLQHFDAVMDPNSHHLQQTIYLATGNDAPRDDTDYFKILAQAKPEEVRSEAEAMCNLESYEDTPSYDQG